MALLPKPKSCVMNLRKIDDRVNRSGCLKLEDFIEICISFTRVKWNKRRSDRATKEHDSQGIDRLNE